MPRRDCPLEGLPSKLTANLPNNWNAYAILQWHQVAFVLTPTRVNFVQRRLGRLHTKAALQIKVHWLSLGPQVGTAKVRSPPGHPILKVKQVLEVSTHLARCVKLQQIALMPWVAPAGGVVVVAHWNLLLCNLLQQGCAADLVNCS